MKLNLCIIAFLLSIALAAMPAPAVPYFLAMLCVVLALSPLALLVALPVHYLTMRNARRKAAKEFTEAYDAHQRAKRDPFNLDASGCESHLLWSYEKLKSLKP